MTGPSIITIAHPFDSIYLVYFEKQLPGRFFLYHRGSGWQRDVYTCIDPVNYKPRPFTVRYFRVIATQHSGRSYRGETLN